MAMIVLAPTAPGSTPANEPTLQTEAGLRFDREISENGWVALRFNITSESDLSVDGRSVVCEQGVTRGLMSVVIADGALMPSIIAPALDLWGPFDGIGEYGIDGSQGVLGQVSPTNGCYNLPVIYRRSIFPANESVVLLTMIGGSSGSLSLNATWSKGVTSWDVVAGTGTALTRAKFERGSSVSTYTFLPPGSNVHAGTAVAVDLRHAQQTALDAVGYFAPHAGGIGTTSWSCSVASAPCPTASGAIIPLQSRGVAEWAFEIRADARVSTLPYYAVMVAELPDNSYLR